MAKILITGADGMVGSRFVELYKNKNDLLTPTISDFDLLDIGKMKKYILDKDISCVVNFAAYTDVGKAESQRGDKNGMCWKINVDGIKKLSIVFKENIHFVQISTDMVFPGNEIDKGPYSEGHKVAGMFEDLSWYGYSKAKAEESVTGFFKRYTIIRINYPVRAKFDGKQDFFRKSLSLYEKGDLYPLFDDQQITITYIDEFCELLDIVLNNKYSGIFHCASSNVTTPYEVISYLIYKKYGKNIVVKESIKNFHKNNPKSVRYPIYGGLRSNETEKIMNIHFSSWKTIVDKLIEQGL